MQETERLAVLVGRWKTEGWTTPEAGSIRVDAIDTYEWLHGGCGLLHTVEAGMGGERVQGAEIIGWDPDRSAYVTLYFGTDGPNAYEATLSAEDGALVWWMQSERDRFEGTFSDDRSLITGHWELLGERGGWQPWMDITLTRQAE